MPTYERQIAGIEKDLKAYDSDNPRHERLGNPIPPETGRLIGILHSAEDLYNRLQSNRNDQMDHDRRVALIYRCDGVYQRIRGTSIAIARAPFRHSRCLLSD